MGQAGQQKAALEQQAMQLAMEYEQRKAEESMYRQQYDIQRQQMEMARKMADDYQRMGPLGGPQVSYPPSPSSDRPSYVPEGPEPLHDPHGGGPYWTAPPRPQAGGPAAMRPGAMEPPRRHLPEGPGYMEPLGSNMSYRPPMPMQADVSYRLPNGP